jgi:putative flavoprotein involved in K+ transport
VSPNWTTGLLGFDYDGADPDAYMPRDAIVERMARYADVIDAPVELATDVTRLTTLDGSARRIRLETNRGPVEARDVVVAAGAFHTPKIPAGGAGISPGVRQMHSHHYRNERELAPGAVLIIGSGQTGVQLAEELHEHGRTVFLSVGHCGRAPRRYRGRDIFWWLRNIATRGPDLGVVLPSVDKLPDPRLRFACNPHLSGHGGGHDTNLRRMAANGIRLVGRFEGADGTQVRFAPDLAANLQYADTFFDDWVRPICEQFIERAGIDAGPDDRETFDYEAPEVTELDLAAEGISTVLWTTGYQLEFDKWIDLPIFDEQGVPRHQRGITDVPGLTFLGLPWQLNQTSANLSGFALDARYLADRW